MISGKETRLIMCRHMCAHDEGDFVVDEAGVVSRQIVD